MNITIILCTYNRCQTLAKALASVAAQSLPAGIEWEVLVVDNNSQDQTRDIVEGFGRENPGRFHYLYEPQQGLSNARNAGIQNSRGEILAFMDDDVTVKPTWLQNLTAALHDGEWAGAGGRTLPSQPFSPPDWLSAAESFKWGAILGGLFDLGEKPCELKMAPYGTNMAFRKSMFEKYGGFRPDLDRSAGSMLSNGDTEFGRRLMIAGERLRYEPLAIVYHPILEKRDAKTVFFDLVVQLRSFGDAGSRTAPRYLEDSAPLSDHFKSNRSSADSNVAPMGAFLESPAEIPLQVPSLEDCWRNFRNPPILARRKSTRRKAQPWNKNQLQFATII